MWEKFTGGGEFEQLPQGQSREVKGVDVRRVKIIDEMA